MSEAIDYSEIDTVEKIARHMSYDLSFDDRKYIKEGNNHDGIGRYIRNEYGLWIGNPLTHQWRTDESTHNIIDGVDYSKDHPDNVSESIRLRLVEILNEEDENAPRIQ